MKTDSTSNIDSSENYCDCEFCKAIKSTGVTGEREQQYIALIAQHRHYEKNIMDRAIVFNVDIERADIKQAITNAVDLLNKPNIAHMH
jgi:3-hydroxyacyl-CoA dehydrogenase